MPDIYEVAQGFRARIVAHEADAARELAQSYAAVHKLLKARLDDLMLDVKQWRREHGKKAIPASWVYRQQRYRDLIAQVEQELKQWATLAGVQIGQRVNQSATMGTADAISLLGLSMPVTGTIGTVQASVAGSFNQLPSRSLEALTAFTADGSLLKDLFDSIPGNVTQMIRRVLVSSLGAGLGARDVARAANRASGMGLTRAMTISRTETLRAYREATRETYLANSDVVMEWEWLTARSERTCPVCLAMDGKRFQLSKPFGTHPNCRCTMIPVITGNTTTSTERVKTASEWFQDQPEKTQRSILGNAKYEAFRSGEITLDDLVGYRNDPKWGPVRFEKSLEAAMQ